MQSDNSIERLSEVFDRFIGITALESEADAVFDMILKNYLRRLIEAGANG